MLQSANTQQLKVALVTGAAKRIGAVIARELHASGFNLVIHYYHSAPQAKALIDELNSIRENSAAGVQANLADHSQVTLLADKSLGIWQRMDVVVNNASSFYPTPIDQATEADWENLMSSNLKSPFFLAQALAPALKKNYGCIINIADIYAQRPLKNHSIYSIAKAGNIMLTKSLAQELAPEIRVNGIAPGAILWPESSEKSGEEKLTETHKEKILNQIPLQATGTAEDIAKAILFLTKDAPYITGQILAVDGGRSLTI